jgi:hypothetical protein
MAAALVLALGAAACGSDSDSDTQASGSGSASGSASGSGSGSTAEAACKPVGDIKTAATEVDAELTEWSITAPATATAGKVGFVAKNVGKETHELVVVKTDDVDSLPSKPDGSLGEDKLPAGALVGEIEGFPAGESCTGVFDMPAGKYALICNIVEKEANGEVESHLKQGMKRAIDVKA